VRACACVCGLSYPAQKAHAPHYIAICGLSVSATFFLLYLIIGTMFEKITEHKKCVLTFSTTSVWNISHYKKNQATYYPNSTQVCISHSDYGTRTGQVRTHTMCKTLLNSPTDGALFHDTANCYNYTAMVTDEKVWRNDGTILARKNGSTVPGGWDCHLVRYKFHIYWIRIEDGPPMMSSRQLTVWGPERTGNFGFGYFRTYKIAVINVEGTESKSQCGVSTTR
jgi:hypothetical protein